MPDPTHAPINYDDELRLLREAYERPPAAVLWGVATSEAAHNRFLQHLLAEPELGVFLLRAMVRAAESTAEGAPPILPAELASIRRPDARESTEESTRVDESLWLRLKGGTDLTLLVELKFDAGEGETQLATYLERWKPRFPGQSDEAAGLLLRFTDEPLRPVAGGGRGTSKRVGSPRTVSLLTLSGYCQALESVLGKSGRRVSAAAIEDHHRTCRMLLARERLLLKDPSLLMSAGRPQGLPDAWLDDNQRWASERLLRGVEAVLVARRGERTRAIGAGIHNTAVTRDPSGVALNFRFGGGGEWHTPGEAAGFVSRDETAVTARGFFKLRASKDGVVLEVQTITESYPAAPAAELEARVNLHKALWLRLGKANWGEVKGKFPETNGKSGWVAAKSLDWLPPAALAQRAWEESTQVLNLLAAGTTTAGR